MNDLPDWPGFDSVECKPKWIDYGVAALLACALIALLGMAGKVFVAPSRPDERIWLPLVLILGSLVILRWLLTELQRNSAVITNDSGISANSLIKKIFLSWDEIEDATSSEQQCRADLHLKAGNRQIKVDAWVYPSIAVSVWQHLRRRGKADNLLLPANAMHFWQQPYTLTSAEVVQFGAENNGKFVARLAKYVDADGTVTVPLPDRPLLVTMDSLPQQIFLAADGKRTLEELLAEVRSRFAAPSLETDLDELATYEIIKLSREGLLILSDTPVEVPD